MAMILTGERINSETAERFGLLNQVVAYADLAVTAQAWADKINKAAPLANQAAKAAANGRLGYPLDAALMTKFEEIEQYAGSADRSEEHTSELQSLMRISYAVFCLKKKKKNQ